VIDILLQVRDALIAAHAANVVHRDLKLDNVFLIDNPEDPAQPRVKLLDWGIAKVISNDVRHTIEGQLVGTPQYLSPEQARGATVTPQSDVYSLGVMAFELFLEQLPFEAETSAEIMAMHLRATPPPPSELWPDIPPGLEHLMLAMLAKDPDARPTMLTVAHTLELVRSELERRRVDAHPSEHPVSTPTSAPRRTSYRHLASPATGLAPTEQAAWPDTKRRWHVVIGAFALATSAALFLVTRQTEPADASPQRPALVGDDDLATAVQPAAPAAVSARDTTAAGMPGDRDVVLAEVDAIEVEADTPRANVNPAPPRTTAETKTKRAAHPPARKPQVKPRLESTLDPDGTLDPYR
jgi:hypothetical protein